MPVADAHVRAHRARGFVERHPVDARRGELLRQKFVSAADNDAVLARIDVDDIDGKLAREA